MALAPGTDLGPYQVRRFLGAGGMGEVYEGRDTRLKREVAIKVLPPGAGDSHSQQRFQAVRSARRGGTRLGARRGRCGPGSSFAFVARPKPDRGLAQAHSPR
jgi:hypothetical protein